MPPDGGIWSRRFLGLMIEVHNNPKCALCDGAQSLDLEQFAETMADIRRRAAFEGRVLQNAVI